MNTLQSNFIAPPAVARPHTWWHWNNGHISREGITADLEAIAAVGIAGVQLFYPSVTIPHGPVAFDSPEWHALVLHAARECKRLGLEFCMHNCPGWSSSGGPWIKPEYAMKVLTSADVRVQGPARFSVKLPLPPARLEFYRDVAVLAFRTPEPEQTPTPLPIRATTSTGVDASAVFDGDPATFVDLERATAEHPCYLEPYGSGPFDDLQYGARADVPICEFWADGVPTAGNAKLAASIGHVHGKPIIGAESFTSMAGRWQRDPFALKTQADLAFTHGVNRLIFHTCPHQPWLDPPRYPGVTLGNIGTHFGRQVTWWSRSGPFMDYLARCQYLLQEGVFVADFCFYTGGAAPWRMPEVDVVNLWPNRLIGDEQLKEDAEWKGPRLMEVPAWLLEGLPSPTGRVTFTTWKNWKPNDPLLPSGLFGPVRLILQASTSGAPA